MQRGSVCETDEDCYAEVMRHRFVWAEAEDVTDLALSHPGEYTAAVVFDMPLSDTAPIDSFTLQVRCEHAALSATGLDSMHAPVCPACRSTGALLRATRAIGILHRSLAVMHGHAYRP